MVVTWPVGEAVVGRWVSFSVNILGDSRVPTFCQLSLVRRQSLRLVIAYGHFTNNWASVEILMSRVVNVRRRSVLTHLETFRRFCALACTVKARSTFKLSSGSGILRFPICGIVQEVA